MRIRFSTRLLLVATAVAAIGVSIGIGYYRDRVIDTRPLRLRGAIQRDDLAELDHLLKIDPALACGSSSSSLTPLGFAISFGGSPQAIDRLLQEKPDVDERSSEGATALLLAIIHQRERVAKKLLQHGADSNLKDNDGMAPIHRAIEIRSRNLTKLLLEFGADPEPPFPLGENNEARPLHVAAWSDAGIVAELLAAGADVNGRDARGRTPLHWAIKRDNWATVIMLANNGADLAARDNEQRAALMPNDEKTSEAAFRLWYERIVDAHDRGKVAELNRVFDKVPEYLNLRRDYGPATLLHAAAHDDRFDIFEYLLARDIDPDIRGIDWQTVLHDTGNAHIPVEFAERLLAAGADIEANDRFGHTPLLVAVREHDHESIRLLLANGADIEVQDHSGTKIMDAAFERRFPGRRGLETLQLLRDAGHQPTLPYAVATNDIDLFTKLSQYDPDHERASHSLLHVAVISKQPNMVRFLLERGFSADCRQEDWPLAQDTPLIAALGVASSEIALVLIEHGANVNFRGRHGYFPAHAVIAWDRDPIVLEALVDHGAKLHQKYRGKTVLELAKDSDSKHRDEYLKILRAHKVD